MSEKFKNLELATDSQGLHIEYQDEDGNGYPLAYIENDDPEAAAFLLEAAREHAKRIAQPHTPTGRRKMSNTTLIAALKRIADMTDRDGNPIEMHIEELRGIARAALLTVEQKSSNDHLDYGGGGLHGSPSPAMARSFHPSAAKYVACPVRLTDIAIHPDGQFPEKCKFSQCCKPVYEVDEDGEPVANEAAA